MTATPRRFTTTLGFWSLMALVSGLALGVFGFRTGNPWVSGLAGAVRPLGGLWMNALQAAVLPLVVLQLLTAIAGNGNGESLARAGKRTAFLVVLLLGTLAAATYVLWAPLVRAYSVSPETAAAIRESILIPTSVLDAAARAPASVGDWLMNLIPANVLEAGVRGDLIQILLVTVVFGLAVNHLPEKQRKPLGELSRAGVDTMMIVVRWILVATPVGVFALVIGLALGTGSDAVGLLGFYVLLIHGVLIFFILLMYPLAALLGRVPLKVFARAALAPQLVAVSTRSSLASMPAQIESGRERLGFGETTSGFVVPLLVSTLKIQTAIENAMRVLFLAHIFRVSLSVTQLVTFSITIMLISFTSLGIPNGGAAFRPLPAYLAVGIPVEGLVLIQAVKDINDYIYTLANTTGQFAAATILSRHDR